MQDFCSLINGLSQMDDPENASLKTQLHALKGSLAAVTKGYQKKILNMKKTETLNRRPGVFKKIGSEAQQKSFPRHDQVVEPEKPEHNLSNEFIEHFICNLKKEPKGRSYSENIYNISFMLYTLSPKCYQLLRQILPLPTESCLNKKFGNVVRVPRIS
jgi:hypothetical protein